MSMRLDCEACIQILEDCLPKEWAETFVRLKMRFYREHCMPLLFSTIHGADFFENIIKCLDGMKWEPDKDEPEPGEYEENFRKFIKRHQ